MYIRTKTQQEEGAETPIFKHTTRTQTKDEDKTSHEHSNTPIAYKKDTDTVTCSLLDTANNNYTYLYRCSHTRLEKFSIWANLLIIHFTDHPMKRNNLSFGKYAAHTLADIFL